MSTTPDGSASGVPWVSGRTRTAVGFEPESAAVGEYNGKFMSNQMILNGNSGALARGHVRAIDRAFFYRDQRWQFTGARLAERP